MRTAILRSVAASALAAFAIAAAPAANATNLLVNGSFEDSGTAAPEGWGGGGGYTFYYDHGATLPGWTVESGSVDVTTNATGWSPAADGVASLDINGWTAGQIWQEFDTIVGQTYQVSFAFSRNAAGAPDPALASVSVGSNIFNVVAPNDTGRFGTPGAMTWETGTFNFVGTGSPTKLFLTAGVEGNGGVYFDKVSVSAAPEPTTWALMIGGFGMAGAALRRRRTLAVTA